MGLVSDCEGEEAEFEERFGRRGGVLAVEGG